MKEAAQEVSFSGHTKACKQRAPASTVLSPLLTGERCRVILEQLEQSFRTTQVVSLYYFGPEHCYGGGDEVLRVAGSCGTCEEVIGIIIEYIGSLILGT